MSIRSLVENKSILEYKALTFALIQEIGINEVVNWDAVIPATVQHNLFGGEILRLFSDHEHFANQKDIRTISLKKGETSQLLFLFAKLKDEKLSKASIERITKRFIGGQEAERYVVWFLGNPDNSQFKVVLSGKEGKKIVLKTLSFGSYLPYYKTYDFILDEIQRKVSGFFIEPNELWKALWKSFDISVVNKKFYEDIKKSFDLLVNNNILSGSIRNVEARKQFVVRLIGRIIFCWFLKKKTIVDESVLSFQAVKKYEDYYGEFLEKLFFDVFNTPQKERSNDLPKEIKNYPFLNGGLFEDQKGDFGDYKGYINIPNDWFEDLFKNTLEKYNFTIDENTSSNSEIAIDPEMLGRIFENLLAEQNPETQESARKSTGSYYTPREIVDYMVEQSLSEYLKSNAESALLSEDLDVYLEDFFHTEEFPEELKPHSNKILEKLNSVKVLDPACGSGAFPIGMLQKLIALKIILSKVASENERGVYRLKLDTILNSIYGCDIQPMAVELSRLRCWLSLIIDEPVDKKKENWGIEPLPHLDFKFVCGNTLIGLAQISTGDIFDKNYELKQQLKNELKEIRDKYFILKTKKEKEELQKRDKNALNNLLSLVRKDPSFSANANLILTFNPYEIVNKADFFDPDWMYGVTAFDICIGNPPYIRQEALKPIKELLQTQHYFVYNSTSDIYTYFYERAFHLLKPSGILCFITSNKWMRAKYGDKLRKFLKEKTSIISLIDFSGYKVFESATVDTNILICKKSIPQTNSFYAVNVSKDISENNFNEYLLQNRLVIEQSKLNQTSFTLSDSAELNLKAKIEKAGLPLIKQGVKIYRGIITGFNQAFIIDTAIRDKLVSEDPQIEEFIKPILRGRDISRYRQKWDGLWLIKIESGYTNLNKKKDEKPDDFLKRRFPSLHKYFNEIIDKIKTGKLKFKGKGLVNRDDQGDYWWEQRDCVYYEEFEKSKIIYPDIDAKLTFAIDNKNYYLNNTCYFIRAHNNIYLISVLNSSLINWYYSNISSQLGDKAVRHFSVFIEQIPIIMINEDQQKPFIKLVEEILAVKKQNPQANTKKLEDQIDFMVYKLYDLTYDEVRIIDSNIESKINKDEYGKYQLQ